MQRDGLIVEIDTIEPGSKEAAAAVADTTTAYRYKQEKGKLMKCKVIYIIVTLQCCIATRIEGFRCAV